MRINFDLKKILIKEEVMKLPPPLRKIIIMRYWDEFLIHEISTSTRKTWVEVDQLIEDGLILLEIAYIKRLELELRKLEQKRHESQKKTNKKLKKWRRAKLLEGLNICA